jgi:hypothetical protein
MKRDRPNQGATCWPVGVEVHIAVNVHRHVVPTCLTIGAPHLATEALKMDGQGPSIPEELDLSLARFRGRLDYTARVMGVIGIQNPCA